MKKKHLVKLVGLIFCLLLMFGGIFLIVKNMVHADSNAISITKTVDKTLAAEGQVLTYHLHVVNNTATTINNVVVTDIVPNYTVYVPHSAINNSGFDGQTITWSPGNMTAYQAIDLQFQATVDLSVLPPTPISVVSANPTSFDPTSGSTTITTSITTQGTYRLVVKDGSNNIVRTLADFADLTTGTFTRIWDGKDTSGQIVADGTYTIANECRFADNTIAVSGQTTVSVSINTFTPLNSFYGAGVYALSLANLEVGRSAGRQISYRFKAKRSGLATGVRIYLIYRILCQDPNQGCYANGTGGQVKVELKNDDGSSSHLPGSTVLATDTVTDPMASNFRLFSFNSQAQLEKDTIYHLVFTNPDSNPTFNYTSIDDIKTSGTTPMLPTYSDDDLAVVWKSSSTASWAVNRTHTPVFTLYYADGTNQGQGYIDFLSGQSRTISGNSKVRETFTVTGGDRTISQAAIKTNSGSGALTIRLERSDGTLIKEAQASLVSGWLVANMGSQTLINGLSYNLVFSSTGSYTVVPLQKGSMYSMGNETYFKDGWAQSTTGTSWTDVSSRNYCDFPFYME